jgi:hypothetical protein
MMSARDRQARRPDMAPGALRQAMAAAGFKPCEPRALALAEWWHEDTGARRYVWWNDEPTNATFRRLIGELDAGRVWNGAGRR